MKLTIRTKIIIISLSILLIAIILSTAVSAYIFITEHVKVLENNASIIGQNLKMQIDRLLKLSIPLNDIIGFEKQCKAMVDKYDEISYAMVVNRDGKILFHNDLNKIDESLRGTKSFEAIKSEKESLYTIIFNNKSYYEIAIPVYDDQNSFVGIVSVGFPESVIYRKISNLVFWIVLLTVIFLIISIFLLIIALKTWVTEPLASLVNVIKEISENKFLNKRVKIYSDDEIGHLSNLFNKMTEELQHTTVSKVYVDSIIQNMVDSLIVIGLDSKIKTVNNAVCDLLQYSKDELLDKPNKIIFVELDDAIQNGQLDELLKKEKISNFETNLKDKEGNIIPVLSSITLMKDEDNNPTDIIFAAIDITDRKKAEDDLRNTMIELREARDALWGEMQLAEKIQTALVPDNPVLKGYEVSANMTTTDSVGGDYFDIITIENYSWLVIGDVSGHGISAGLIMMMAQTAIHTVLHQNPGISPRDLLSAINKTLTGNIQKLGEFNYMTITVVACLEDDTFSCTGLHLPLLVYRSKTKEVEMIDSKGMWLGLLPDDDSVYQIDTFKLENHDGLLLYTDGIVESKNDENELFSLERLIDCFKENGEKSAESIKGAILAMLNGYTIDDDISLLVLKKQ